jgi:hypothetical protein
MAKPYTNIPRLIASLQALLATGGMPSKGQLGRILATLQTMSASGGGTAAPIPVPTAAPIPVPTGAGNIPPTNVPPGGGGSSTSFKDYFYPVTDTLGVAASIGGRIANAVYKSKAAKQLARGNAAQHIAASLSTPQSQQIFGSPLGELAKVSADAGQAAATKSLAKGEAWQGSLQDISNFISSINMMRRLIGGNAMSAYGLLALQRMYTGGRS